MLITQNWNILRSSFSACAFFALLFLSTSIFAQDEPTSCTVWCPSDLDLSCEDSTDPEATGYPSLTCYYDCGGCTLTYGYWKTHSEYGPAPYDETWAQLSDGASTEFFATGESWHTILWTSPAGGNAYLKLAHQWIAVHMNMLAGAPVPDAVADAYSAAQQLLSDYDGLIYIPNGPDKAEAIQLASLLDSYNNGDIGPGHCEDGDENSGSGPCEEEIDAEWSYNDEMSGDCPLVITRTWSATVGDQTYTCEQTLSVTDDVDPVLAGIPDDQTGLCDQEITPAEVTATDNCDDDVDVSVDESSTGEGCNYVITFTYTATDDCGNTDTGSYSVSVLDETPPTLEGAPEDDTVECDSVPAPAGVTASDNCDNDVPVVYSQESSPSGCNTVLMRTWTAVDDCGNSVSHAQVILVMDTTAPELFGIPADTSLDCDEDIPDAIVFATDNCDEDLVISLTAETIPQDCGYQLVRTWWTEDDCGNEVSESQTITVVDSFDPVVVDPVEEEITRACDDDSPYDTPSFEDGCDEDLTITETSETLNDNGCEYDVLNTWTAEDDCGNSVTVSQLIHYVDGEAPVLSDYPADIILECGAENPTAPELTVADNCDDGVELNFEETIGDEGMGCQLLHPNSIHYDPSWAIWLQNLPIEYQFYELTSGSWTELDDGSIHIQGVTASAVNPNGGWIIDVMLHPGMDWDTWQSQAWPNWYKDDFGTAGDNYLDWFYFVINNDAASLTGWGDFEDSYLDLVHAPSSLYYGYQLGIGANNVNQEYGSGGWFGYEGTIVDSSTGYNETVGALGDFALNHDCCDAPPITWTWTAEDCAGNSVSHTTMVTFVGANNFIPGFTAESAAITCEADFNGDGIVKTDDMLIFLQALGCMENCTIDLNGDGITNSADMLKLLTEFGNECE